MRRGLLVIALLLSACGAAGSGSPSSSGGAAALTNGGGIELLGEKRSEGGAVEVVASWSLPDPPSLKLAMDTHSVDLDGIDVAAVARLRLDGGDWVAPTQVDAPQGGHHRSATLIFATIPTAAFASARVIELRVTDVGVAERLMRWERAG